MPAFSACYFCGTALDAPLAEYPVVPEALHPTTDQQRTVVLCPSCRRKLGAVVDAVVDAVDEPPAAASIQRELTESGEETAYTSADSEHDDADATTATDSGFEFGTGGTDSEQADETSSEAHEEGSEAKEADSEAEETGSEADGEQSEPEDGASQSDRDRPDEPSEQEPADATATTDESHGERPQEPQLTALEYNKVMRLLQNRDFPVDRAEFKLVATNAYEIDDEEFDAIIEAAADRDLIGIEGGNIVEG